MLVFFVPLKYILLLKKGKSVTIAGKKLQHIDSISAPARVSQGLTLEKKYTIILSI